MTREFLPYYPAAVTLGCHLTTLTDTAFEAVYGVTKAAVRVKADALEVAVTKGNEETVKPIYSYFIGVLTGANHEHVL